MTTKTGSTELRDLPDGPPLPLALAGAIIQLSTMHYVWSSTAAGPCLRDPIACVARPWDFDAFGRTVIYVDLLALITWLHLGRPEDV
eukprot:g17640.t1